MDPETESNSDGPRDAAAAAVSPDPVTADLLAKHSAGQKLTPQEYGKISWVGRKFPWLAEKFGVKTGPAQPAASPGDAPAVASGAKAETPGAGLPAVEIDSSFVERTTLALLRRTDAIAVRVVGNSARKASAFLPEDKQNSMVARFERAAAMSNDDKKLLAELTPECARALGWDPKSYPLAIAGSVFGLYVADLTMLVLELKELRAKQDAESKPAPPPKAAGHATATPAVLPDPIRPPNAPPVVFA